MTANGRWPSPLLALSALAMLLYPQAARCGNLEMVEKNVEELESVNREALGKLEGMPRSGAIDLKAYVTEEGGKRNIKIDETKTTIKDAAGKSRQPKPPKPLTQVEVSAPTTEGTIEYQEGSTPANKITPGGGNVR